MYEFSSSCTDICNFDFGQHDLSKRINFFDILVSVLLYFPFVIAVCAMCSFIMWFIMVLIVECYFICNCGDAGRVAEMMLVARWK